MTKIAVPFQLLAGSVRQSSKEGTNQWEKIVVLFFKRQDVGFLSIHTPIPEDPRMTYPEFVYFVTGEMFDRSLRKFAHEDDEKQLHGKHLGRLFAELADDADGDLLACLDFEGAAGVAVGAREGFVVDL